MVNLFLDNRRPEYEFAPICMRNSRLARLWRYPEGADRLGSALDSGTAGRGADGERWCS